MANKWATACPFVVLANLSWENNMTESSVIYFPPPPTRVEGRNGEGCKTNRRPATTGNFVIDVAQLQQRTLAPSQAKPSHVESRLVQDEDEDKTASVAEVVANEVHANPAQSLRLDLALIFG